MTTIEIKYKTIAKWLFLVVCICLVVIIYLLKFEGCGVSKRSVEEKYKKEILEANLRVDSLEEKNGLLEDKIDQLLISEERVNFKYNELKSEYDRKTRLDKNKQAEKRFRGKISILNSDSNLVCFDSSGVDSMNRVAMEYDRLSEIVPIKDSVIANQASIITNDSLVKEDLNRKFERAENYARTQKSEADYQRKSKNFWIGLSAGLAAFQAVIVYTALTR